MHKPTLKGFAPDLWDKPARNRVIYLLMEAMELQDRCHRLEEENTALRNGTFQWYIDQARKQGFEMGQVVAAKVAQS